MPPQSVLWKSDRAVLFVHGVGNARPGDYDALVARLRQILGDEADDIAFYFLYYDEINSWFAAKTHAALRVANLVSTIRSQLTEMAPRLGAAIADFAGDVIWPVLLVDGRHAVRAAYLSQLQQMLLDAKASQVQPRDARITIIAHSLGCFHTYEALQAATRDTTLALGPVTAGFQVERVIYMASPVQLIRSVAQRIDFAIPQHETLYCLDQAGLATPSQVDPEGRQRKGVRNTVSITGNLDPVGGHFFRAQAPWAYMNLADQQSFIDQQQVADAEPSEEDAFVRLLQGALRSDGWPAITPLNPHDWTAYVERHGDRLREWLS